ncbi:peptidoglycan DD-metalloendopeptidase family protein [Flavobacteriaceae bacterium]|nr:peptidoglycan DD-metalloendopeptidase family protein [Flavobacteriaceae bacterium]
MRIPLFSLLMSLICLFSCSDDSKNKAIEADAAAVVEIEPDIRYGFDYNQYTVKELKIKRGDTFGAILERNGIDYPQVYEVLQKIKGKVNVRKLQLGKPYTLLFSKNDSVPSPKVFIYHPDNLGYSVIQLRDSIYGEQVNKPIRTVELQATGVIQSSLYETMQNSGYNANLTYFLSDVYAWTIDFTRLDKGDRFKVIYTEKFVDDSISVGIDKIKAAYFEHRGKGLYAYEFETDSIKGIVDYFDENAKNLRRAFLKSPVKFSRISSRYNLKRRIAYYGRVKPHKGTDYAAPVGTPIMATANGRIEKASYTKGNGNYVKVKHNTTYSTQYLHMKRRKVKVGQYVKQGDVIGWVGMTGNTSGPHVCYRFWKNGRQVDPFKQKLPEAKPISKELKKQFFTHIEPISTELECLSFENEKSTTLAMN